MAVVDRCRAFARAWFFGSSSGLEKNRAADVGESRSQTNGRRDRATRRGAGAEGAGGARQARRAAAAAAVVEGCDTPARRQGTVAQNQTKVSST